MNAKEDKSCFTCGWNKVDAPTSSNEPDLINPPTFLGVCHGYLSERGKPMEIQANKRSDGRYWADVGCKKWTAERQDFAGLTAKPTVREEEL
jgi:hypothetical protein